MIPDILQTIRDGSPVPVDRMIVCRASGSMVRSVVGKWPFVVLGFEQDDMSYFLDRMGARKIEGRLPKAGAPEAIVSRPVAVNLNLKLGSVLLNPEDQDAYSPFEVKVVGIAETDEWLMANSIEYQRANHFPPIDSLVVFARNAKDQETLDYWAEKALKGNRAQVFAFHRLETETEEMFRILYQILNVVIGTVVLAITIMMAMLMNIYQSQRLVEFGLLQAIGYTKRRLLLRVFRETFIVLVGGWALGVIVSFGFLSIVKAQLMDPNAFVLDKFDTAAYLHTLPVPTAVLIAASFTVLMRFRKFDPVAVIERRLI
jgi:ABC-type lipoprotein release transport system permease subunit